MVARTAGVQSNAPTQAPATGVPPRPHLHGAPCSRRAEILLGYRSRRASRGASGRAEGRPTQPRRVLAQAEIARGNLLAAVVGLTDADLDAAPPDGGWPIRRILGHVRDSEVGYLEAARLARAQAGPAERVSGEGATG